MVRPGQHIRKLDHNRMLALDPREAYVFFTFRSIAFFDVYRPNELAAGSGKSVLWYVLAEVRGFAPCSFFRLVRLLFNKSR